MNARFYRKFCALHPAQGHRQRSVAPGGLGADEEGRLAYEALPPERRGAKIYQRVDGRGHHGHRTDRRRGWIERPRATKSFPKTGAVPFSTIPGKCRASPRFRSGPRATIMPCSPKSAPAVPMNTAAWAPRTWRWTGSTTANGRPTPGRHSMRRARPGTIWAPPSGSTTST
jgi:hypothetical protein